MILIRRKDKEKVYEAIRRGKIDEADMSFSNLIDDILLTMKRRGLTELLSYALPDKRRGFWIRSWLKYNRFLRVFPKD